MIFEQQALWNCPKQTYGASDFLDDHAQTSQSQENKRASLMKKGSKREADCSLKLLDSLQELGKKIDPNTCSVRMLKIYYLLMQESVSRGQASLELSLNWMNWGMTSNGRFSTQKITECHKTEKGCSLSDILEEEVEEKYFLSNQQTEKIILNSRK